MSNASTLSELIQAYDYFTKKSSQYENANLYQAQLDELNEQQASLKPTIKGWWKFLLFLVISAIINTATELFWKYSLDRTVIIAVISVVIMLLLSKYVNNIIIKSKTTKIQIQSVKATAGLNRTMEDLTTYYSQYENNVGAQCPLAFEYTWPNVIALLSQYVQLGRADTIKEALNLLAIDTQHNESIYAQQANMTAIQQAEERTSKALKDIYRRL